MADTIEWIPITRFGPNPIGAIGFLGNDAVAIAAFYEDADANKDGKVSWWEWTAFKLSPVSMKGMAVTEVAMAARNDETVMERDPTFNQEAIRMYTTFAGNLIADGVYAAYFARGISLIGTGIAGRITSNMIKQFAIRKGFESAVKKAFRTAVHKEVNR